MAVRAMPTMTIGSRSAAVMDDAFAEPGDGDGTTPTPAGQPLPFSRTSFAALVKGIDNVRRANCQRSDKRANARAAVRRFWACGRVQTVQYERRHVEGRHHKPSITTAERRRVGSAVRA